MMLSSFKVVAIISYMVVNHSEAIKYHDSRCSLSDVPACGPKGVCNECSFDDLSIDCSDKGLFELPSNLSSGITTITFEGNHISCVPKDYFERFTKLTVLALTDNKIRGSFSLPPSLKYFSVKYNQLEDVGNFFIHCDNLRQVKLGFNKLTAIPDGVFRRCSKLKELRLHDNYLQEIRDSSFDGLDALQILDISYNQVPLHLSEESISSACASLETLNFLATHLMNLPPGLLRNCTRLLTLKLRGTGITDLTPDTLRGLPLFDLDISSNNLREIPKNLFCNQAEIGVIMMTSTKLKTIPESLFEVTSVYLVLDIGNNDLTEIPPSLFSRNPKGHGMTTLFLSGNKLTFLPKGLFSSLRNLQNLYLHGNKFSTLPGSMLVGTTVEKLYIFQNQIRQLTEPLFGGIAGNKTLREIVMQDNPIRHLSQAVLNEVIDGGFVELSCENLNLPTVPEHVNATCKPPSTPMAITADPIAVKGFSYEGFYCSADPGKAFFLCKSCPVGTYGMTNRNYSCKPCPRGGFYQDQVGQYSLDGTSMNCKTCNPGTFVNEGAGESPLSCKVCPSGTNKNITAGFRACSCLDNYFRRDRFGKCEPCSQEGGKCASEYMTITADYFWDWSFSNISDYRRFVENLQTFDDSYLNSETTFKESLPKIHKCFRTGRCTNDKDTIAGNCAEGYTGWMCTACEKNYFPILGFCRSCPELSVLILDIFFVAVVVVILVVLLLTQSYGDRDSLNPRSFVDRTLALGKIVLGFYQVMGEFWESIDVMFWPHFFKVISSWLDLLQFNISSILVKPSCFKSGFEITPYTAFVVGSSFPYFAVACALLIVLAIKIQSTLLLKRDPTNPDQIRSRMRRYRNNTFTFLVLLLFVTYPSTCNVTFDLFSPTCDTFSLDEHGVHNITVLRSDYSIDCTTATHRRYQIASYCASIYVIALPAVLCFFLWRHTRRSQCELCYESPKWVNFLSENYQPQFWFWEIVELFRKLSQTFVVVIFGFSSYFSIVITLTLAVVFLTLHISFKPMKDKLEYYLQLSSLWGIFFNMLIAAVPVNEIYDGSPAANIMATFLVIINTSVIGVTLVEIFVKLGTIILRCFRRMRQSLEVTHREDELINNEEVVPLIH